MTKAERALIDETVKWWEEYMERWGFAPSPAEIRLARAVRAVVKERRKGK